MGKFKITKSEIEGVFTVEPTVFGDERGYFMETYNENDFKEEGIDLTFVQDNQSKSSKGVLRGLHFQYIQPQGKLVRVIKGEVFDVAVDLRKKSDTYGNGLERFFLKRTRNSFSYQRDLLMDFWFYLMRLNSFTNALISIMVGMKEESFGMILT